MIWMCAIATRFGDLSRRLARIQLAPRQIVPRGLPKHRDSFPKLVVARIGPQIVIIIAETLVLVIAPVLKRNVYEFHH